MKVKCSTYPPATTPKRSLFTAFTSISFSPGPFTKPIQFFPWAVFPSVIPILSILKMYAGLYFCQFPPDLLMKHKKLSYQICPQATQTITRFSPSKGWDQSQSHCHHELATEEVNTTRDFSSYEVYLITTSNKWKQKSFPLWEPLIFIRSELWF